MSRLDPDTYDEYCWWLENHSDPERGPAAWVDPKDLGSAGWAVIFGRDIDDDVEEQLAPLLNRRRQQATRDDKRRYATFRYQGESKQEFLEKCGASWGPADPENLPYYILLVGSPQDIPFDFQYGLDVQYAVGRIHFHTAADYGIYANQVVAAETESTDLPRHVTFFGIDNPGDETSHQTFNELTLAMKEAAAAWNFENLEVGLEANGTRNHLRSLLAKSNGRAFLFAATHGMRFQKDDPRQIAHQGALVCSNVSGRHDGKTPREGYFAGEDVPETNLHGLVACLFGCFTAGCPRTEDFNFDAVANAKELAPYPFVSSLAQKFLLRGSLAILGHIDRTWTSSFTWSQTGDQVKILKSVIYRMLEGWPVGFAMEYMNHRYTELATQAERYYRDRDIDVESSMSKSDFERISKASLDSRNFVVIGDPAVCLKGTRAKR